MSEKFQCLFFGEIFDKKEINLHLKYKEGLEY